MAFNSAQRVLLAVLWVCASACGAPLGQELFVHGAPLWRADAIVVLGNRPPRGPDGRVAPETARRVRRGAELYARGLAPLLIVTGGRATGGGTEADVMAAYARELGVPAEAIRMERRSRDTAENARYAIALLCEGRANCHPRVIVVSSAYHLRRARRLFECAGSRPQVAATETPDDRSHQIGFAAHEYGVRIAYIFVDACAVAGAR